MTAPSSDLRAWLAQLTDTHTAATVPFWQNCGCLAGLGEIPSASECHQAGLCAMRQRDRKRDNNFAVLLGIVGGLLDLADDLAAQTANTAPMTWKTCKSIAERLRTAVADAIEGAGQ